MPTKIKAKRGQPTKKNSLAIKRILKVAASGLPLHFCAEAGNISRETLIQWRKQDPQFDQLLQAPRLKAVERRWKRIEKAAKGTAEHPPDWKADAWSALIHSFLADQICNYPLIKVFLLVRPTSWCSALSGLPFWQLAISKLEPRP